jgi:hypothetical protein
MPQETLVVRAAVAATVRWTFAIRDCASTVVPGSAEVVRRANVAGPSPALIMAVAQAVRVDETFATLDAADIATGLTH